MSLVSCFKAISSNSHSGFCFCQSARNQSPSKPQRNGAEPVTQARQPVISAVGQNQEVKGIISTDPCGHHSGRAWGWASSAVSGPMDQLGRRSPRKSFFIFLEKGNLRLFFAFQMINVKMIKRNPHINLWLLLFLTFFLVSGYHYSDRQLSHLVQSEAWQKPCFYHLNAK